MADAFENILGQPKVREFLRASVVSGAGDPGLSVRGAGRLNKTQAAYALAQALMCSKAPRAAGRFLRRLRPLRAHSRRKHPDGAISPGRRERVSAGTGARDRGRHGALSHSGRQEIYILIAYQLGRERRQRVLKTLEEPADDVVMILLGRTRESVLPTIVSDARWCPSATFPPRRPRASWPEHRRRSRPGAPGHRGSRRLHHLGRGVSAGRWKRAPAFRTRLFSD
ncbi:MAG: hypothetical protein ACLTEX_03025 [Eggerthella lenta]